MKPKGQSRMNNPETGNIGHIRHRRAIKNEQSIDRQHWTHKTQNEDKQDKSKRPRRKLKQLATRAP